MTRSKMLAGILLALAGLTLAAADRPAADRGRGKAGNRQFIREAGQGRFRRGQSSYAPGTVLVKFTPSMSAPAAGATLRAYGLIPVRRIPEIGLEVVRLPKGTTVEDTVAALRRNPDVLYAEPDFKIRVATTPNDEYFDRQWALSNPGSQLNIPGSPQGVRNADINATTGWDETKGDASIIIAVLDTGVDLNHPDLQGKLVSAGRDFANNDNSADDDDWHGTHVAGIAAAATNNNEGIAGVAWNCRLLPIKVVDAAGEGQYSWLIDGILYAVANGARVINISLGGDSPASGLEDALRYAKEQNVVVVASAGNHEAGELETVSYPAAYDAYVLAVGATDYLDERQDWSNYGPEMDVAAPGVDVLSLVPTGYFGAGSLPYAYASGTSMSAPHVAGLAALLLSHKSWLKPDEVMGLIRFTAADVNSSDFKGRDDYIGFGRIDMGQALLPYKLK